MKSTTGFTDTPISSGSHDTLGITHYLKSLAAFIRKCETPLTISIQGAWGTGKTSAMNIIKEELEQEGVPTVWFNTWQFSQFSMQDYLPVCMLNSLTEALGSPLEVKSALEKVWSVCAGAGMMAIRGASMIAMEKVAGETFTGKFFGDEKESVAPKTSPLTLADDIMRLKSNLASGVKTRLESCGSSRLVIFIDDLDRLEPGRAVELLEVIKNFVDVSGCVFVLAIDHSVVEMGIKAKFGLDRTDLKGRSFFDKIIQLSFNLPVAQYNTEKYINGLIEQIGLGVEDEKADIDKYVKLIASSVGFNPRGMKRIFNLFQLLSTVSDETGVFSEVKGVSETKKQQILFGLLCMQTSYHELYLHLVNRLENLDLQHLEALTSGALDGIYAEIDFEDPTVNSEDRVDDMIEFMNVFVDVLDFDRSGNISQDELDCLKSLLGFSAITNNEGLGQLIERGKREKFDSFDLLRGFYAKEHKNKNIDLALSIYQVLDQKIENYAQAHGKPYFRNITKNANVTYNIDRSINSVAKGRRSVVFFYSYAQKNGIAGHITPSRKISLRSPEDVTDELIAEMFNYYDVLS